jgi:hypothetical protein
MGKFLQMMLGKSWKTSFIGWSLIVGGIFTGVTAKGSWTDASVTIGIGIGLLQAKDGDKK